MKGIAFKDQTTIFQKPGEMADDQCGPLPVKVTTNEGYPALESVWELSNEELELIQKTKKIRLGILGRGMPPVYLHVERE